MGTGLGILAKAAFRLENKRSDLVNTTYPTTPTLADGEESILGGADLLPFKSESLEESYEISYDETLIGGAGTPGQDVTGILPAGGLALSVRYDALDQLIGAALGFELPTATASPTYENNQALSSTAGSTVSTFTNVGAVFTDTATDAGKFIRIISGLGEGQVRKITTVNSTTDVDVTPNWAVTPGNTDAGLMAIEFEHTFECSNQLKDQLFTDVYSAYPLGGVGAAGDQIIRRGTLGIEKNQATGPWIYRGCLVNSLTFTAEAGQELTINANLIPFDLDRSSAVNTASTTWDWDFNSSALEADERIVFSDTSYIRIDAASGGALDATDNRCISSWTLNINNNMQADDQSACTGKYRIEPARAGMREITGSFTVPRYETDTFINWKDAETPLIAEIAIVGSTLTTSSRSMTIFVNSFKITKAGAPVQGAGVISQTFDFRALIPVTTPTGFPAQNLTPKSEITIQTLNQNPFNVFRDQNAEY